MKRTTEARRLKSARRKLETGKGHLTRTEAIAYMNEAKRTTAAMKRLIARSQALAEGMTRLRDLVAIFAPGFSHPLLDP